MNVRGLTRTTGVPSRRVSAISALDRCALKRSFSAAANASTTMNPALCRFPAYFGPGLPNPTTSQRSVMSSVFLIPNACSRRFMAPPLRRTRGPVSRDRAFGEAMIRGRLLGGLGLLALGAFLGDLGLALGGLLGLLLGDLVLGLRCVDRDDSGLRVGHQRGARGQLEVACGPVPTGIQALDVELDVLGDVSGLGLDGHGDVLLIEHAGGPDLTRHGHGDVDLDLLALGDDQEVDVLHEALDGVTLNTLGQGEVVLAHTVDTDQDVRGLQGEHELVARQVQMAGLGAVAVEDGRHLARAADATSGALAEFRAGLGSDTYLGHDKTPRVQPRSTGNTTPVVRTNPAEAGMRRGHPSGDTATLVPGVPGELSPDPSGPGTLVAHPCPLNRAARKAPLDTGALGQVYWLHRRLRTHPPTGSRRGDTRRRLCVSAFSGGSRLSSRGYSNRLVTDPSVKTSRTARATSGAIDNCVSFSKERSSGIGRELVTITSEIGEFCKRSTAGPESTPWVAAATTLAAPCSMRASAALTRVPPVSIMSSTSTQVRPSTSPTTSCTLTWLATSGSRRLWMIASGEPSRSAQRSAVHTRPASGETTVMSDSSSSSAT